MKTRFIIATLAGGVVSFFLGWLVFGVLLAGFYEAHTIHYTGLMKDMPDLIPVILSNLLMGFLLTFIFECWAATRTLIKGIINGLILCFLWILIFDLYFIASMNLISWSLFVVDVIVNSIIGAIIGGVIGWILGFKVKEAVSDKEVVS